MKKNGFTLIEMLVGIVLISLLIGVAVFSFRMQLNTITKAKQENIQTVILYSQIRSIIESIKFYVVDSYDSIGLPTKNLHYFFQGNEKKVTFITTNPLLTKNDALVSFTCKENQLLYKEEPLFFRINFLLPSFKEDSNQTILFKNLDSCKISYLVNNKILYTMKDSIPTAIKINLKLGLKKITIFTAIKSNDILRKWKVYNAKYPQK